MINWERIYNTSFFAAPECWKRCGSYCCNNFYAEKMTLVSQQGVILPFFPGEFEYYQALDGVNIDQDHINVQEYQFEDGNSFAVKFMHCSDCGLCLPEARPMICRLYPFYPKVNFEGCITGFGFCALMDMLYANPGKSHPCWLVREEEERICSELRESLSEIAKIPEMIFAFKAIELIERELRAYFPDRLDRLTEEEDFTRFIRRFEMAVLSRKPWSGSRFITELTAVYDRLKALYGTLRW